MHYIVKAIWLIVIIELFVFTMLNMNFRKDLKIEANIELNPKLEIYAKNEFEFMNLKQNNTKIIKSSLSSNEKTEGLIHKFQKYPSNKWVINFNISQYTTIATLEKNIGIQFQLFAFINKIIEDIDYLKSNLRCLIQQKDEDFIIRTPFEIYEINFKRMVKGPKSIWRIKCRINFTDFDKIDIGSLAVALVDFKYFDFYLNKFFKYKDDLVIFQKPLYVKIFSPKRKAVAHCLHKVISLNQEKFNMLINWIFMQQKIGIDRIKMCLFSVSKELRKKLKKNFESFIELIDHQYRYNDVCKLQIKLASKNNSSVEAYQFLLGHCNELHKLHFQISYYPIFQHQQMICTQACYTQFRYEYEFITNYDFDELILPRKNGYKLDSNLDIIKTTLSQNKSNNQCEIKISNQLNQQEPYKIYDLANHLYNKYGRSNAFIKFKQVVFLNNYERFVEKIIRNQTLNGSTEDHRLLQYSYGGRSIHYKIFETDYLYFNSFGQIRQYFNCLNETYLLNHHKDIGNLFNNPYATHLKFGREGKSIFNTNYTETYDAHGAKNMSTSKKYTIVPLSIGFVNHFRSNINKYFKYTKLYSFDYIKIDLEFYLFLIRITNDTLFRELKRH